MSSSSPEPVAPSSAPEAIAQPELMLIMREPVLLLLLLLTAMALFAGALMLTRMFHERERQLAEQWFERGKSELAAGRSDAAIADFRSALLYQRDNPEYRLNLAQALVDSHHYSQAESYFRSLLEVEHADGLVNLELGRIAALTNRPEEAIRNYQNAIYGIWPANADAHRREVRLELIDLLLKDRRNSEAEAQLIALGAELPHDSALLAQVAGRFAQVGDYARASDLYSQALGSKPQSVDLLMGLGNAEFNRNDYASARQHLTQVLDQQPNNQSAAAMAHTADLVLSLDPYERIADVDRRARVIRGFQIASARLVECQNSGALPEASIPPKPATNPTPQPESALASLGDRMAQMAPRVTDRNLRDNPHLSEKVIDMVFTFERQAKNACGELTPEDDALLRIAALHTP